MRDILEKHARWSRGESDGERADLRGADLRGADLRSADLSDANLRGADLRGADLSSADLSGADLSDANLRGADLRSADLSDANLSDANLRGADLRSADLSDVINAALVIARTRILPEGDLVAWKKCRNGVLVQLLIPLSARRSHAFGRKCRAEAALVMAVEPAGASAESMHTAGFFYVKGETVRPDKWDEEWTNECGGGIHFYVTKEEAKAHE